MALQKTPIPINFIAGLDTKTDKYQVPVGKFLELSNSVFTSAGRLTKRNGYEDLTTLPNTSQTNLTTLNDSLVATGSNLYSFNADSSTWSNQGNIQPVSLSVQPLVRSGTSQTAPDIAIANNGLVCLVYTDSSVAYYQISDSQTGQQVIQRTALPSTAAEPRVFILGNFFIITFVATVAATNTLQFIGIPIINPGSPKAAINISADTSGLTVGYDCYSIGTQLFVAWGKSTANMGFTYINPDLSVQTAINIAGISPSLVSITVNEALSQVYITYWDTSSTNAKVTAYNYVQGRLLAPTTVITTTTISELTSAINSTGTLSIFYQVTNNYSYQDSGNAIRSDYIASKTITIAGVVSSETIIKRSLGLASKAFIGPNSVIYMLAAYGNTAQALAADNSQQPSYFLIDSSGNICMRLAYSNGGGYKTTSVLPNVPTYGSDYYIPYRITDFLTTTNKDTNLAAGTPVNAIFTQTGINLAKIGINDSTQHTSEIAGALHLTGGQLWEYDGVKPVEHGFHVWPENVIVTTAGSGGLITAQVYFYAFTYEWTDNAGNLHRSAASIPAKITTSGATSTNTIKVPTLRLTSKISPNPVRIVGYRWSAGQQVYYQFTSVSSPTLNDTTVDQVTFTDTLADASILGNAILYTTGGVIENIAAPAAIHSALFSNRLFLIDAEEPNVLWFSKQVIQNVPVEMSDLLTLYVAPTSGAQGSTGPMTALGAMDDKLILFKKDAIYYINGNGPDNTGSNSTFSDPVFINSTVGCSNPNSVVLMPNGVMFQSDKGIWLLSRGLETTYIGAPVEAYNSSTVLSATAIPGTNQVRFVLDSNVTLMYDYFYQQWATHTNIGAISATLYQSQHTYLNSYGHVFQEKVNSYTDGSSPVLMSLKTSWINIAGVQGFERFYSGNLLGTYFTPFKLNVTLAYNYNGSASQSIIVTPDNYAPAYGDEAVWGSGGPWGGSEGNVFTARLFPQIQKCSSFQVSIQEMYDSSLGAAPGEGLSLSGLLLLVGMKRGSRTQSAAKSFG